MPPIDALGSVMVFGGCGFLGHHLVQMLLDTDDVSAVTVSDLSADAQQLKGARYVTGSITSREDILRALEAAKPRVLFHTVSPQALGNPKKFTEVNVGGTRTLLQCAQESSFVKALVYTSSS